MLVAESVITAVLTCHNMPAVSTRFVEAKHRGTECGDTQVHTQRPGSCFVLKGKGKGPCG
jgi:hypothetical protein